MVQIFMAKERITWKNIIKRSPWWGGFYECLAGAAIREYYGRLALYGKVTRTPKIRNMRRPIASTTLPQSVRRIGGCVLRTWASLVACSETTE
ncbi:hypothetical protein TNCV_3007561 [Trichonephila clavipes]|nr:hypothetical protein TNCV_3007561 [Trichonephila clavipes]